LVLFLFSICDYPLWRNKDPYKEQVCEGSDIRSFTRNTRPRRIGRNLKQLSKAIKPEAAIQSYQNLKQLSKAIKPEADIQSYQT